MAEVLTEYNVIPLPNQGNTFTTVLLGSMIIEIELQFNYIISCWSMNIYDSMTNLLVAGVMLVPNVDLLVPYPGVRQQVGGLAIVEKSDGDSADGDNLGSLVQLLWCPPDEEMVLPNG